MALSFLLSLSFLSFFFFFYVRHGSGPENHPLWCLSSLQIKSQISLAVPFSFFLPRLPYRPNLAHLPLFYGPRHIWIDVCCPWKYCKDVGETEGNMCVCACLRALAVSAVLFMQFQPGCVSHQSGCIKETITAIFHDNHTSALPNLSAIAQAGATMIDLDNLFCWLRVALKPSIGALHAPPFSPHTHTYIYTKLLHFQLYFKPSPLHWHRYEEGW